jgi:hypothetical protein
MSNFLFFIRKNLLWVFVHACFNAVLYIRLLMYGSGYITPIVIISVICSIFCICVYNFGDRIFIIPYDEENNIEVSLSNILMALQFGVFVIIIYYYNIRYNQGVLNDKALMTQTINNFTAYNKSGLTIVKTW